MTRFIALVFSISLLFAAQARAQFLTSFIENGQKLESQKILTLDGKSISTAQLYKKPLVLIVIDPDSGQCKRMAPTIKAFFSKPRKFNLLFVFLRRRNAQKFQRTHDLPGLVTVDPKLAKRFKMNRTPFAAIFARGGKLVAQSASSNLDLMKFLKQQRKNFQ